MPSSCATFAFFAPFGFGRCGKTQSTTLSRLSGGSPVAYSSGQILVSEPPPYNAIDEAPATPSTKLSRRSRVWLHVAFAEPEGELVNVAMQVLVAGVMIDAMQIALQDGPDAFDAIGRDAIANVLARGEQSVVVAAKTGVAAVLVNVDGRAQFDALPDFSAKRLGIGPVNWSRFGAPVALAHAEDNRLADRRAQRAASCLRACCPLCR
jgi:hypothetical protein